MRVRSGDFRALLIPSEESIRSAGPVSLRAGYVRMFRLRVPACQETGPPGYHSHYFPNIRERRGPGMHERVTARSGPSGKHSNRNQHLGKRGGPEGPYPYGPDMFRCLGVGSGLSGDRPSGQRITRTKQVPIAVHSVDSSNGWPELVLFGPWCWKGRKLP